MNVLMISPAYPAEMGYFTQGLARVGARVVGLGDSPEGSLPQHVRESLSAYVQVSALGEESAVIPAALQVAERVSLDRVETLWEPLMITAAKVREMVGVRGMTVEQTLPFRDKEIMKRVLEAAGIRMPRHASATTAQGCHEAAEYVGLPLVIKPIAGAGSSSTYRVESQQQLVEVLRTMTHVDEVSIEEFVEGEDCTFDTLTAGGEVMHYSMSFYRPRALTAWQNAWISPQTCVVRDVKSQQMSSGHEMGFAVLDALKFDTGYTHMEWYRTPSGEAVFGEIAARSPGANLVDLINYAADVDTYTGWAEITCHGTFSQQPERRYNAVSIFKRAQGHGRIQHIEGLGPLMAEIGAHVCALDLLPIGAPRRNTSQTLTSDGMVILRHPDLDRALEMADRVATDLRIYAG